MTIRNGIYRAMGNNTRREIVRVVQDRGTITREELVDAVGASRVSLHHIHLPLLRHEGIISEVDSTIGPGERFSAAVTLIGKTGSNSRSPSRC